MISDKEKKFFEALQAAFVNGHAGLIECTRVSDGARVVVLAAVWVPEGEVVAGKEIDMHFHPFMVIDPEFNFLGHKLNVQKIDGALDVREPTEIVPPELA